MEEDHSLDEVLVVPVVVVLEDQMVDQRVADTLHQAAEDVVAVDAVVVVG